MYVLRLLFPSTNVCALVDINIDCDAMGSVIVMYK